MAGVAESAELARQGGQASAQPGGIQAIRTRSVGRLPSVREREMAELQKAAVRYHLYWTPYESNSCGNQPLALEMPLIEAARAGGAGSAVLPWWPMKSGVWPRSTRGTQPAKIQQMLRTVLRLNASAGLEREQAK